MLLCNKWGHPGWYRTTVLLGSFTLDSFPWWKVKGTQCFPGWNGGHFTRHFTAKKRWQAPHRAHSEIKLFFVSRLLVNNFRVKPVHKPSLFLTERPHICSLQERAGRKCLNTNSNGSSADGGRGCKSVMFSLPTLFDLDRWFVFSSLRILLNYDVPSSSSSCQIHLPFPSQPTLCLSSTLDGPVCAAQIPWMCGLALEHGQLIKGYILRENWLSLS